MEVIDNNKPEATADNLDNADANQCNPEEKVNTVQSHPGSHSGLQMSGKGQEQKADANISVEVLPAGMNHTVKAEPVLAGEIQETDTEETTQKRDQQMRECIRLNSTAWDDDNASFNFSFRISSACQNMNLLSFDSIYSFDCFTFTWRPLAGLRPQDISTLTENLVLGKSIVHIPATKVSGAPTCSVINDLLQNTKRNFLLN